MQPLRPPDQTSDWISEGPSLLGGLFHFRRTDIDTRAQSSRLAEFGGRGMSFNICRGSRLWPLGYVRCDPHH
jgi:hypothetical protein